VSRAAASAGVLALLLAGACQLVPQPSWSPTTERAPRQEQAWTTPTPEPRLIQAAYHRAAASPTPSPGLRRMPLPRDLSTIRFEQDGEVYTINWVYLPRPSRAYPVLHLMGRTTGTIEVEMLWDSPSDDLALEVLEPGGTFQAATRSAQRETLDVFLPRGRRATVYVTRYSLQNRPPRLVLRFHEGASIRRSERPPPSEPTPPAAFAELVLPPPAPSERAGAVLEPAVFEAAPTSAPEPTPTSPPRRTPTSRPTVKRPSVAPTRRPSVAPTRRPSVEATRRPSVEATRRPSVEATRRPARRIPTPSARRATPAPEPTPRPPSAPPPAPTAPSAAVPVTEAPAPAVTPAGPAHESPASGPAPAVLDDPTEAARVPPPERGVRVSPRGEAAHVPLALSGERLRGRQGIVLEIPNARLEITVPRGFTLGVTDETGRRVPLVRGRLLDAWEGVPGTELSFLGESFGTGPLPGGHYRIEVEGRLADVRLRGPQGSVSDAALAARLAGSLVLIKRQR
jgi:hypothetical protein